MNKKLFLSSLAVAAVLGFSAQAQFQKGGFTGPVAGGDTLISVEQAKALKDDSLVKLQGNIVQKVGSEKYLFKDKSGSIEIEIDDEDWQGQEVGPEDTVLIEGEVDKGWTTVEIDVERISKASK